MPLPVALRDVAEELTLVNDQVRAYINRRTGEVSLVSDDEMSIAEAALASASGEAFEGYRDWQRELLKKAREIAESEDWLQLPGQFDIHEYAIMERFCLALPDPALRGLLLDRLRGRRAFRRFKDAIHDHGIAEDWYAYRQAAIEEIAAEWLNEHGIPYSRA